MDSFELGLMASMKISGELVFICEPRVFFIDEKLYKDV